MAPLPDRSPNLSFWERFALGSLLTSLFLSARRFLQNLFGWGKARLIAYPEEVRKPVPGARLLHRLMKRPDGSMRCTACMLCAEHCPSRCISIQAGWSSDPAADRFAATFDIDLAQCLFCGLCVQACPIDALRMDSGKLPPVAADPAALVRHLDELLAGAAKGQSELSLHDPPGR